MGLSVDLADTLDGEAEINTSKDMEKKRKFVPVFQKLDLATSLKMDILNEDGYKDPFIVDGILTGALTDEMKSKTKRISHQQRLVSIK